MIFLILVLTIVNTILIFFFYKKQNRIKQQIIEALKTDTKEIDDISEENKSIGSLRSFDKKFNISFDFFPGELSIPAETDHKYCFLSLRNFFNFN